MLTQKSAPLCSMERNLLPGKTAALICARVCERILMYVGAKGKTWDDIGVLLQGVLFRHVYHVHVDEISYVCKDRVPWPVAQLGGVAYKKVGDEVSGEH